jgi:hypothetical protein
MKKIVIGGLLCIIVFMSWRNTNLAEGFEPRTQTIVLLGDSILKNNVYVKKGVDQFLNDSTDRDVLSLAQDGAVIGTTYKQLEHIPGDLNTNTTVCVLSVGGNNIIEDYIKGSHQIEDNEHLITLFDSYKDLVKRLREKMNKAAILLLDIYYPTDEQYKEYYPLIRRWNQMQSEFADTGDVVKISKTLTQPRDFVFAIEPSDKGGKKIADSILSAVE